MDTYVVTFDSTECAMDASDALAVAGIHFRTLPTPLAISAGCGIALRIDGDEMAAANAAAIVEHTECGGKDDGGRALFQVYKKHEDGYVPWTASG